MKTLLWMVTVGLALLWSLGAWLTVQFFELLLGLWPSAGLPAAVPAGWTWPAWVELWWPREQLHALLALARDLATWLAAWIPSVETWQSLLAVGAWLIWGLGMVLLMGLALGAHWWLGRSRQGVPA